MSSTKWSSACATFTKRRVRRDRVSAAIRQGYPQACLPLPDPLNAVRPKVYAMGPRRRDAFDPGRGLPGRAALGRSDAEELVRTTRSRAALRSYLPHLLVLLCHKIFYVLDIARTFLAQEREKNADSA